MKAALTYLIFVCVVLSIGIAIGIYNLPGVWYQSLAKPTFNPPNWIFGPAWSILYIFIGIAGARTWLREPAAAAGARLWFSQMVLNYLWSPFFFGLQLPKAALGIILVMLVLILAFIGNRWSRDRFAALLFVPYAAWVAFASVLNASIVYLN